MTKISNFEIDLEIYKLELDGIDKMLDIVKLILVVGVPVCAGLLSQGLQNWWQWIAFGLLLGFVVGAFIELFRIVGDRNEIIAEMKQKYLNEKSKSRQLFRRKESA